MKGPVLGLLTMLAIVAGASHAYYDHKTRLELLAEDNDNDSDSPKKTDGTKQDNKPKVDPNFEPAEYKSALANLEAGKLSQAQSQLTKIPVSSKRSLLAQKIRLALHKVRLYRELTEIVALHQFADGKDLYLLVLPNGEAVMARIRGGTDEPRLKIAIRDGRRIEMKKSRLKAIKQLSKDAFLEQTRKEYEARLAKLGGEPRPVSLFRTVIAFCLEFGLTDEAFKHLKQALKKPAGGVLIDLFCEGDIAALHRAHADLAGMSEIAMFDEPEPIFDDTPEIDNTSSGTEKPTIGPSDTPKAAPKKKANPLLSDPLWQEADRYYRDGLKVYRRSFGGGESEQAVIAQAKDLFQKAQEVIYKLDDKYPNDQAVERRGQDLQQLIYDCVKREKL